MINYTSVLRSNSQDEYSQVFKEAVNTLKNTCHINALNGAADLYSDSVAFNRYAEKLVEGFDANTAEDIKKLLKKS